MKKILMILIFFIAFGACGAGTLLIMQYFPQNSKTVIQDEAKAYEDEIKELPLTGVRICIDPGHGISDKKYQEAIAPGTDKTKPAFVSGTQGITLSEEELNLIISKKLYDKLVLLGADVCMTRTTHRTELSNIGRAEFANEFNADLSIKIHADGSENKSVQGISVLIPDNTYIDNVQLCEQSKKAANIILDSVVSTTNANNRGTVLRKDMTGFNWSKVPVILIEVGFMSNQEECILLESEEYQTKIVEGISTGVVSYFSTL